MSVQLQRPVAYLRRKVNFCAAHRLCSPHLSEEENATVYGKCFNPNGHGHNYVVEATLKGEIDPITGMVINLSLVKEALKATVIEPLDHKNLDKDVPYFQHHISTTENLAVFIFNQLREALGEKGSLLYEVTVHETENNTFIYRGE